MLSQHQIMAAFRELHSHWGAIKSLGRHAGARARREAIHPDTPRRCADHRNANPGGIQREYVFEVVRCRANQTKIKVQRSDFVPEESPTEIGKAIAMFVRKLRVDGS